MKLRKFFSARPRTMAAIISIPLVCTSGCTYSEVYKAIDQSQLPIGNFRGSTPSDVGGYVKLVAEAIAVYSSYRANRNQVEYVQSRASQGRYDATGNDRIVAVSVPNDPNAKKSVQNQELASKPKKTVMLWDNEKGKLADSKAYEIDANQAKSGTEMEIGGKKVLYTGL